MAYKKIENFRFWCQKVLPTIYDDSLSYYEVLCKIRDLINDIITNMDSLAEVIEDLDNRLDAVEAKLNDLSKLIIDEVKKYIQSDEFVEQLIDELTSSQTFNNWFHDFITENPDLIQDLINSKYFDEYFNDYITNNPDIVNSLLSNPNFISNFAETMARQTDFYDIANISDGDISKGGLVSNFYAIGKNSQIAAGTRLKVMYRPTVTPIVGKFERTSSGGFYNWASDGDTNYTSFIIDMSGFEGRNLYVKIDEAFDPYSFTFIKRGSLDTGGVSVTSDKGTPTGQASYIPGDYLKLEPTKAVNFVLISIKNNGVAFNPTFTYSMRNVDFDSNTDTPVLIPFNAFEVWNGASDTAITNLELFKPNNELAYIIFGAIGSTQYGLSEDITSVDSQVSNLQEDMAELKNSVSDGKALVASAITDKGVATAADATFNVMASNIRNIQTERAYPNGFFKKDSLTDITNDILTVLPSQYGFTNIDMLSRSWRIYNDLLDAGFNVHSFTETTRTVDDATVTDRTFRLSPPSVTDIGYLFSYTDLTLTSIKRYTNILNSFASNFSSSSTRFLIKRIKNSYCIINFINDAIPSDYLTNLHFLSDAYDSNGVLFGCLFDAALNTRERFDFSKEGGTTNGSPVDGSSQRENSINLFVQDLFSSAINTGDLVTPFYIDSYYSAGVIPTPTNHTETYIFKSVDGYEFLLLGSTRTISNYRPIRIK